ncbi:MAG: DUF2115 domain-containing protein [Methanocorpusculum sp.]|nr:DUF2115 domain-containing protein [Methanocorpusculum sp.]
MRFWNRGEPKEYAVSWAGLARQRRRGELLACLQKEAAEFTPDDLDVMMVRYDAKIAGLPAEYRAELARYARVQIPEGYNRLMTAVLDEVHAKEKLRPEWKVFVRAAERACSKGTPGDRFRSLKYVIAAFAMFVLDEPGHPVGMPFPGGLCVERYEGVVYCPVREAWADVDEALCGFCPARQSRERDMVLSRDERDLLGREEKLTNYFYNFKG